MVNTICPLKLTKNAQLVKNLKEKKRLLDKNDPSHKKYKTALVIKGGLMYGIYGGSVCLELIKLGFGEVFDVIVTESVGTCVGAYFLSQQEEAMNIFYKDVQGTKFFNPLRFYKMLDLDYFEDVLRNKRPMNVEKIRNSRSELLFTMGEVDTGNAVVFSSKDKDVDIITAIKAACSYPGFYNKRIYIKGKAYFDGTWCFCNSVDYTINTLGCTDVLVLTNRSCTTHSTEPFSKFVELLTASLVSRRYNKFIKHTFHKRLELEKRDIEILWQEKNVSSVVNVLCADELPMSRYTRNVTILKSVAEQAAQQTRELFI